MRPIRSTTLGVFVSAVLATSLAGCQLDDQTTSGSDILVAADLELSGPSATAGKAYQRALELRIEQINASGALGDRKLRLEVRDNRSDPAESLRNINDLAKDSRVSALVMGGCSECAVAAAKPLEESKLPTIALAPASAVASPVAQRRYMFKLTPDPSDSAAAIAASIKDNGGKKVGLLHTDDSYGREGLKAITTELGKVGVRLRKTQVVKPTDTDLNQAVRGLVQSGVDAIVVWTPPDQAEAAMIGAEDTKFSGSLYLDSSAAGELFLDGVDGRTAKAVMVFTQTMVIDDVIATTPAKAARKQWFRDYTARFGGYYGSSSFAADAASLIAEAAAGIINAAAQAKAAAAQAGVTVPDEDPINRDRIRDVLETSQMDGLSGPIRITPDDHSGLMPQALTTLVARGGRWRLAE